MYKLSNLSKKFLKQLFQTLHSTSSGRGASGGQVRDEKRKGRIDPARSNKRQKTLNWTPAEQVQQQQQQSCPEGDAVKPESGGDDSNIGNTNDKQQVDEVNGQQESNSRFRDES